MTHKYCRICHNTDCSNHGKNVEFHGECFKCDYVPFFTNADKIRSMTDEELARFIMEDRWDCNDCPSGQENMDNPFGGKCDNKCVEHCLYWLRMEVE